MMNSTINEKNENIISKAINKVFNWLKNLFNIGYKDDNTTKINQSVGAIDLKFGQLKELIKKISEENNKILGIYNDIFKNLNIKTNNEFQSENTINFLNIILTFANKNSNGDIIKPELNSQLNNSNNSNNSEESQNKPDDQLNNSNNSNNSEDSQNKSNDQLNNSNNNEDSQNKSDDQWWKTDNIKEYLNRFIQNIEDQKIEKDNIKSIIQNHIKFFREFGISEKKLNILKFKSLLNTLNSINESQENDYDFEKIINWYNKLDKDKQTLIKEEFNKNSDEILINKLKEILKININDIKSIENISKVISKDTINKYNLLNYKKLDDWITNIYKNLNKLQKNVKLPESLNTIENQTDPLDIDYIFNILDNLSEVTRLKLISSWNEYVDGDSEDEDRDPEDIIIDPEDDSDSEDENRDPEDNEKS